MFTYIYIVCIYILLIRHEKQVSLPSDLKNVTWQTHGQDSRFRGTVRAFEVDAVGELGGLAWWIWMDLKSKLLCCGFLDVFRKVDFTCHMLRLRPTRVRSGPPNLRPLKQS